MHVISKHLFRAVGWFREIHRKLGAIVQSYQSYQLAPTGESSDDAETPLYCTYPSAPGFFSEGRDLSIA